jgi:subtilisin family serine protease
VIPKEWQSYYNAKPLQKNASQTNQQHQILIAIVDSGVDYNHPLLKDHVHYQLDEAGQIKGLGWDFLGNDAWPLPYLARTKHLYTKGQNAAKEEASTLKSLKQTLKLAPAMGQWIEAHRNVDDELDLTIFHGTHVAGLASYDDPRIGILPFRILPTQERIDSKNKTGADWYESLEASIEKAHTLGARIINLSVGTSFGVSENGAKDMIEKFKKFEVLVNKYNDMIFVAAAGNESTWVNGETRYSFPCGVKAPNMVCVASINQKGGFSEFTNIPLVSSHLVFAMGEKVIGPLPNHFCDSKSLPYLSGDNSTAQLQNSLETILKDCPVQDAPHLAPLSGTSMAAPIVARALAQEILNQPPQTRVEDIIASYKKQATQEQVGPLTVNKFRFPVPSWYPKESDQKTLGLRPSSISRGYFEFYSPN